MKTVFCAKTFFCTAFTFLCLFFPAPPAESGTTPIIIKDHFGKAVGIYQNSFALVMALDDYAGHWPNRPGALQSADEVADVLRNLRFAVTLVKNPKTQNLRKQLVDFINLHGQKKDNRLLIYFSGHCHNVVPRYGADEMEYLIPANTPRPEDNLVGFRDYSISLFHLNIYARNIRANHVLFLLDGCKGSALALQDTGELEGITQATFKPVRQFILLGEQQKPGFNFEASGKRLTNGLKGAADLNADGYVTASELAIFLRNEDAKSPEKKRTVTYGKLKGISSQSGDFVFPLIPSSDDSEKREEAVVGRDSPIEPKKAEKASFPEPNLRKTPGPPPIAVAESEAPERPEPPAEMARQTLAKKQNAPAPPRVTLRAEELVEEKHDRMIFWPPEETPQVKPFSIQEETFVLLKNLEPNKSFSRVPGSLNSIDHEGTEKLNNRWTTDGNGTAFDTWSGLMWMVQDFRNIEKRSPLNWREAVAWAEKINVSNFAGYNDWRVPTIEEMKFTYQADRRRLPGQKRKPGYPEVFESGGGRWYWSAQERNVSEARAFRFDSGQVQMGQNKVLYAFGSVRLVRLAKSKSPKTHPVK